MVIKSINEVSSLLAKDYTKIIMYHDHKQYNKIKFWSKKNLKDLNVPVNKITEASDIISEMYKISDEADNCLNRGDFMTHNELFINIEKNAKKLDSILKIKRGSIVDEIRWWKNFRFARSPINGKKPSKTRNIYYMSKAFLSVLREHYRRLPKKFFSLPCAYYLTRAGIYHIHNDWEATEQQLEKYWYNKIKGNKNIIEPTLILV